MRVLICGSREWDDERPIDWLLEGLAECVLSMNEPLCIITGGARGADTIAHNQAAEMGRAITTEVYPADWSKGKRAGYLRNMQMLDEGKPDVVIGFGHGKGTDMMLGLSARAGVRTYRVESIPSQGDES